MQSWSDRWSDKAMAYLPLRREESHTEEPWPATKPSRRRFTVTLQLLLVAFALLGVGNLGLATLGYIQLVPTYTPAQLANAGWVRPPLVLEKWAPAQPDADEHALGRLALHDFGLAPNSTNSTTATSSLNLLILTPLCNAADRLDSYFSKLDSFTHPRINTSLGFIVSDTTDDTGDVLRRLVDERVGSYREVTLLKKDFGVQVPSSGSARHAVWAQGARRTVMAKARTTLLISTLRADVDWVLWLDSDVDEVSSSLFEDLLVYGNTGVVADGPPQPTGELLSDVVAANVYLRWKDRSLHGYDLNNWAETPESLRRQDELKDDVLVVEGNRMLNMHRQHLVDDRTAPNASDPALPPSSFPWLRGEAWQENNLYDPSSPAYVGRRVEIDGVGGVATLVRAEAHRLGAVFPSWLVQHELETEGFGVMAKKVGARVIGLPNYLVIHALNS